MMAFPAVNMVVQFVVPPVPIVVVRLVTDDGVLWIHICTLAGKA
jgi:hypothetical protein